MGETSEIARCQKDFRFLNASLMLLLWCVFFYYIYLGYFISFYPRKAMTKINVRSYFTIFLM